MQEQKPTRYKNQNQRDASIRVLADALVANAKLLRAVIKLIQTVSPVKFSEVFNPADLKSLKSSTSELSALMRIIENRQRK